MLTGRRFSRAKRHWFAGALMALWAGLGVAAAGPNIIMILADDMGWDIAALGHPHVKTPHLDRMVGEGRVFESFYVASPVCSPTRASLLTGQIPSRYGIHDFIGTTVQNRRRDIPNALDPDSLTVTDIARQAGYRTGHYGKWHLSASSYYGSIPDYGIDEYRTGWGTDDYTRSYSSQEIVGEAIDFIDRNKTGPFYLNVWLRQMHRPVIATATQKSVYDGEAFPGSDFGSYMVDYVADADGAHDKFLEYNAIVTNLDSAVGELLDYLDAEGLSSNTLVVFTSDNGPEDHRAEITNAPGMGSAGRYRGRKRSIYEGGVRMPMIARWPGVISAGTVDAASVISSTDWLPTVATLVGEQVPPMLDGEDCSGRLMGTPRIREKPLIWEYRLDALGPLFNAPRFAIRDGHWKALWEEGMAEPELYDVVNDPEERINLAPLLPDIAAGLRSQIEAFEAGLVEVAPTIVTAPDPSVVKVAGDSLTLTVEAVGTPPPNYRWYRDGEALEDDGRIKGAGGPVLVIGDLDVFDAGSYHCEVWNTRGGLSTDPSVVLAEKAPEILAEPVPVVVLEGEVATFAVEVKASEPIGYQWMLNGVPLMDGGGVSGSQGAALQVTGITAPFEVADEAGYSCYVYNPVGAVTSSAVGLRVEEFAPVILSHPTSLLLWESGTAVFSVSAKASGTITYQWTLGGVPLVDGPGVAGATTSELTVSSLTAPVWIHETSGYRCEVVNGVGSTTTDPAGLWVAFLGEFSYDVWANFFMGTSTGPGVRHWDYDMDGSSNLLEFAMGTNPADPGPSSGIRVVGVVVSGVREVELSYPRLKGGVELGSGGYEAADLVYELEVLDDGEWVPNEIGFVLDRAESGAEQGFEMATYRVPLPLLPGVKLLRLRVTAN